MNFTFAQDLYTILVYTPNIIVNINKCLAITQGYDFLRRKNEPYLLRFGVYLFQVHIVSTLLHILLGGAPFWLHSETSLIITVCVWIVYSLIPNILRSLLNNPIFKIIHILLLSTLATNDITQVYDLPMFPDIPTQSGSYITPVLPASLLGALAICLVSSLSGEFVKTCIIKLFLPAEKTSLTSPSLQFTTIGILSVVYHFLCNPHYSKIGSPLVAQYIPPDKARLFIYLTYTYISIIPFILKSTKSPANQGYHNDNNNINNINNSANGHHTESDSTDKNNQQIDAPSKKNQ